MAHPTHVKKLFPAALLHDLLSIPRTGRDLYSCPPWLTSSAWQARGLQAHSRPLASLCKGIGGYGSGAGSTTWWDGLLNAASHDVFLVFPPFNPSRSGPASTFHSPALRHGEAFRRIRGAASDGFQLHRIGVPAGLGDPQFQLRSSELVGPTTDKQAKSLLPTHPLSHSLAKERARVSDS